MLVPALTRIADQYSMSLDTVSTWMVGLLVFWGGWFTFFTAAGSNILGKRPFIVTSVLVLFLTNAWGAFAAVWYRDVPRTCFVLANNAPPGF
jgi:hypothetical protein